MLPNVKLPWPFIITLHDTHGVRSILIPMLRDLFVSADDPKWQDFYEPSALYDLQTFT